jgi:hypothetical protein
MDPRLRGDDEKGSYIFRHTLFSPPYGRYRNNDG